MHAEPVGSAGRDRQRRQSRWARSARASVTARSARDDTADREHQLAEALRDLRDLPAGQVVAWAAGETSAMRQVRRHLSTERGLPAAHVRVPGYGKRTVANDDHHQPLDEAS